MHGHRLACGEEKRIDYVYGLSDCLENEGGTLPAGQTVKGAVQDDEGAPPSLEESEAPDPPRPEAG